MTLEMLPMMTKENMIKLFTNRFWIIRAAKDERLAAKI